MIIRLFLVLLLCLPVGLLAQHPTLKFEHLAKEDGLSSSDVTSIVQDKQGFLWVGTIDGLNRYDGYSIRTYRNIPGDSSSLCDNKISVLYVDRQGELWIGTENKGLSRYDKKTDSFIHYPYRPFDSSSLSFHYVTSMVEDEEGNLWVGTLSGLNRFDRKQQQFSQYLKKLHISIRPESLRNLRERSLPTGLLEKVADLPQKEWHSGEAFLESLRQHFSAQELKDHQAAILASVVVETEAENIRSLEAGKKGSLWLGFEQQGLGHFNPQKKTLSRFRHSVANPNTLSNDELLSLEMDGDQLWIGTRGGGLNRFDTRRSLFYRYPFTRETVHIKSILKDSRGVVWFGDSEGLNRYEPQTDSFYRYKQYTDEENGLSTLFVSALFEDAQGNLWVGCDQGGLNMATLQQTFRHLAYSARNPAGLSKKSVSSVLKDSKGNLWVGYFSMGIDFWDAATNTKVHFNHQEHDPYSIGQGTVFKIFEDSRGVVWVGTYKGGLQYYDAAAKRFVSYRHNAENPASISGNDVRDIAEDKQGNLWIAVHGGGINRFNRSSAAFTHYRADYSRPAKSLASDWVFTVLSDSRGRIWAGSVSGLSVLVPGSKEFISYNQGNTNLSHNSVRTIFEDGQGQIWAGTENGLNLYHEQAQNFTVYTERNGLPNNFIMGGIADKQGYLWISTNGGLSKFAPKTGLFRNYSLLDGLQSNEFFPGAYVKSRAGEFFFGGNGGLNVFTPGQIKDNPYKVPVVISEFSLFNQRVMPAAKGSPLQENISQARRIVLSHDQNVIGFGFVGLNYVRPEKNQYAYMMEGFDDDWRYVGNKREATYTNLDPGEYVFKVKAANNDGLWNEEGASVRVVVLAPWWQSGYAYAVYAVVAVLLVLLWRRIMLRRAQARFELAQERRQAQQLHELDLMKIRFFTNVSHEFRTPLSLILAPLDKLVGQAEDPQQQKQVLMIQRNARRLLNLVNQLLDFRKLEVQGISFYPSEGNIIKFIAESVRSFSDLSEKSGISLSYRSNVEELQASFDMDKLEKILFNLLSNAFKFTEEGGAIQVEVDCQPNDSASEGLKVLHIRVQDSGIGIPKDKHEKVFERFFRNELPSSLVNQGSGIGLAITKEFVKIHGGTISVESEPGKGSCFTVSLPVKEMMRSPGPAADILQPLSPVEALMPAEVPMPAGVAAAGQKPARAGEKKPEVLLIEDNEDFRFYLKDNLSVHFTIIEAPNGKEGWQKALSAMPDLIVSDLMMPEMNGIELCKKIKQDARTSHIPFVLLTAHTAEEQKLKGLNIGANDYITKPFNFEILLSRLRNLIAQRQLMQQAFGKKISVETSEVEIVSLDDKLMQRAMQVVEEHLEDSEFSVEQLSRELGMSRAHLYKKLVSLTGISPVEFIRKIRLQRAAQLLEKSQLTVAEVAYKVGFNNTKYFSKYFKAAYNMLPSQYAASKQESLE